MAWYYLQQITALLFSLIESNKFKYTPGMTYEHEYHVTTETLMEGANSRKATIQISAIADIEVESKCDFILKVIGA